MDDKLRNSVWDRDKGVCRICKRELTMVSKPSDAKDFVAKGLLALEEIPIFKWSKKCWKCGRKTPVVSYNLEVGYNCSIGDIEKLDHALMEKYPFVRPTFSKTMGCITIANTCIHCRSLQGNWFIREDLLEMPYEINMSKLVDFKLPNNLSVEDLLPEEELEPAEAKPVEVRFSIGHIHHKDLNWENNSPENLILLCRDCHFKLHSQEGKKTTARRSRKEARKEARLRREKAQADKWRDNYYQTRTQRRGKASSIKDSPSELFKQKVVRRNKKKRHYCKINIVFRSRFRFGFRGRGC